MPFNLLKSRKAKKVSELFQISAKGVFVISPQFIWRKPQGCTIPLCEIKQKPVPPRHPVDLETFELPEDAEIFRKIETERLRNIGERIGAEANVSGTKQKRAICMKLVREKRNSMSIALKKLYYYLLDQLAGQDRIKSDQRILGESDFVMGVLSEANENFSRKYRLKSRGINFEKVAERVSLLFDLEKDYITGRGRQRNRVRARDLLCYWCAIELRIPMADLSKRLDMTLAAVSYAVKRGEKIAKEAGCHLND